MSEWGNPPAVIRGNSVLNSIGTAEPTGGSEISQYPEEENVIERFR